jgi:hypothetical protein
VIVTEVRLAVGVAPVAKLAGVKEVELRGVPVVRQDGVMGVERVIAPVAKLAGAKGVVLQVKLA